MAQQSNQTPFDWKKEVTDSLAKNFASVSIRFDGDIPTLMFKAGTTDQVKRQAMVHVTELLSQMAERDLLPISNYSEYVN